MIRPALPDPRTLRLFPDQVVPVVVLTGFLGSGKTTIIRRLLVQPNATDTAVVVNEFGEIGLDHLLMESVDENIAILPGGCLCCQARGDLARALRILQDRCERGELPPFGRVVVETSGLANPGPILQTFLSDPLRLSRYRFVGLVTTVDAVLGSQQLAHRAVAQTQVALADRLLVTKLDIAGNADTNRLLQHLVGLSQAKIEPPAADANLLGQLFESETAFRTHGLVAQRAEAEHAVAFDSISIGVAEAVHLPALQSGIEELAREHGENLLRLKGIINVVGDDRPASVHAVQHLVGRPRFLDAAPTGGPRAVVAIFPAMARDEIARDLERVLRQATTPSLPAAKASARLQGAV